MKYFYEVFCLFVNFLIKRNILYIVPVEKTFFTIVDFDSSVKLSYESVLFNFQNLSPFEKSGVSYVQKKGKLLLWFYDQSLYRTFTVPEGFLYYHYFEKQNGNVLVKIEDHLLFAMQDHILAYQIACNDQLCEDESLLVKKFHIKKIVTKSRLWNIQHKAEIYNRPLSVLLQNFLNREHFIQTLKAFTLKLIIPTAILTGLLIIMQLGLQYYLHQQLEEVELRKRTSHKKVQSILHQITVTKKEIAVLQHFFARYALFNTDIQSDLATVLQKFSGHLYYYIQNVHTITMRLTCSGLEDLLSAISRLPSVETYKLTRQIKLSDNQNDISLEITLKQSLHE